MLILSKFDCLIHEIEYEVTGMMRSLLTAEPVGAEFVIMTSHFESLDNPKARKY